MEACQQAAQRGLRSVSGRQGDLIVAAGTIHGSEEGSAAAGRHDEGFLSPLLQVGRMPQGHLTARLALQHHEAELAVGVRLELGDAAVAGLGGSAAGIVEGKQGICAAEDLGGIRLSIAVGVSATRCGAVIVAGSEASSATSVATPVLPTVPT